MLWGGMQGVVVKKLWQHQPPSLLYRERREHVLYHFAVDITQIWLRSSDAKGSQLSGSVEKATIFQVQPKLLLKRKGESKTHQRRAFTFEFFTFLSGIRKLRSSSGGLYKISASSIPKWCKTGSRYKTIRATKIKFV